MTGFGSKADRNNRVVLVLIGLALFAAGAAGLALGTGLLGRGWAEASVAGTLIGNPLGANAFAVVAVVVTVGLALMYLGLLWLIAQLRIPSPANPVRVQSGQLGRTEVSHNAVEHAVSAKLERLPGTGNVRARLLEHGRQPRMLIRLEVIEDADPSRVLESAQTILPQTADLIGMDRLDTSIRLIPVPSQRVR